MKAPKKGNGSWLETPLPTVDNLVMAVGVVLALSVLMTLALYTVWSIASM